MPLPTYLTPPNMACTIKPVSLKPKYDLMIKLNYKLQRQIFGHKQYLSPGYLAPNPTLICPDHCKVVEVASAFSGTAMQKRREIAA